MGSIKMQAIEKLFVDKRLTGIILKPGVPYAVRGKFNTGKLKSSIIDTLTTMST